MDTPLCIKETLENITAPLVERDSAHFIQKSAHSLAHILKFDGLLFLKLNGDPHLSERFSIAYSLEETPTSFVFDPIAFSANLEDETVIKIDEKYVKNISSKSLVEEYMFFAAQFGNSQKTGLAVIGLKNSKTDMPKKTDLNTWSKCCKILGSAYEMVCELETFGEKLSTNTDKDPLTQVHNYKSFTQQLQIAIGESTQSSNQKIRLACMVVSLDDFSKINEKYGFELGNEVLFEIGSKLESFVRGQDTVGRIGGDTFGLILKNIGSRENCEKVSTRVANIFRKGLLPVGEELTASLGVTIYPDDSRDFEQLILKAEHLASEAKSVPGTFTLFSTDEQKKSELRS